ncbi:lamin tail domain-containing protein [Halorussus salilacus]|uniref:lamin tail domain-containing protein n=1 Tax=Halorussus salilacus TaxID=2953750 RepID=UPI0020A04125|nr:lamin tail domain-containing protein [Halorussus salilacus]USZ68506.1 lamin tail domain-containing protein [Halorussus salilacus]
MRALPVRSRSLVLSAVAVVVLASLAGCLGGIAEQTETTAGTGTETTAAVEAVGGPPPTANATDGTLSVHFINVGQGTSVLVVGPTGETLLYDTGNWNDDGEHVLEYLRERGVERIDGLVTSHADADHIGGHAAVIEYYETEADGVGAVYDPGVAAATATYDRYLDAVETHDVTLYRTQAGDEIPMAGADIDVLAPPEGGFSGEDRNENSVALRVAHGNASVLLTGDAERTGERYLRETYGSGLNASVLAAGHHGSNTSTGPGLLDASDPRAVVVQSAYDSRYGHPHDELLARLADRGVPTYWTGVHGTVAFETDGERFAVATQREAPTRPLDLRDAPGVEPGAGGPLELRARFPVGGGDRPRAAPDGGEPTESRDSTDLRVAEVHADAAGDDWENLDDEYVVFRNGGDRTLDLSGWTVADEAGHAYAFPEGTALAPGEALTLHTGEGRDGEGRLYWGSDAPVWNNDGDTVFVRTDEGELVAEESYGS